MVMRKISKYIFSLLILFSWLGLKAQKQEWNGLLIGADLSRFVVPFIDTTRYGWEFSGSYEIINDLFLVAEIGSETTNLKTSLYDYKSAGVYTRLGVDYNFMKHIDKESSDKMLVGLRYGFTTFYHQADNIQIKDDLWGDFSGGRIDRNWLAANWIEVTTGMRARLFNNFYLGWTVQMRVKLGVSNDPLMLPYTIPGYGRPWNNTCVGFNYSLYYKIPIYKKKKLKGEKSQLSEK
jgi:hypothetical protein